MNSRVRLLLIDAGIHAALPAFAVAGPFMSIRIGDVDGFGYGTAAGYKSAGGGSANVDGSGVLGTLDFLPSINEDGTVATGSGDDFDLRTAAEIGGSFLTGSGFVDLGSFGSEFTDIALSTSYDTSQSSNTVLIDASSKTFGAGGVFPGDGNPNTLSNQPGFGFDFFVATGDITAGSKIFLNLVFGDYDVSPARVRITNGTTVDVPLTLQPATADGLIQAAFVELSFGTVFTATGGGWNGHLEVDFLAGSEPYTAFDFVELSTEQISLTPVPEPSSLSLLGCGLISLGLIGRRRFIRNRQRDLAAH